MEFRRMGESGLKVSVVGLGCNNFGSRTDEEPSIRVIHAALDAGITLFDTADVYGNRGRSEEIVGKALGARRHEVIVATKFRSRMGAGPYDEGGSRRYIARAVEDSLRRLGTDYIDLYQMHAPDPETPIEETLSALDDLVRSGKVRYLGNSNFDGWQIADADWTARTYNWERFVSAQNNYSLLDRSVEREVIPACARFGLGMLPYLPLAGGLLTGKYRRNQPLPEGTRLERNESIRNRIMSDRNVDIVERLEAFAEARDISLLDVAIGGLAAQPQVASVIAGATKPEQVEANVQAGAWTPSAEDLHELDEITK